MDSGGVWNVQCAFRVMKSESFAYSLNPVISGHGHFRSFLVSDLLESFMTDYAPGQKAALRTAEGGISRG